MDVIELNEAFASHALAMLRDLGLSDEDPRVNSNGGRSLSVTRSVPAAPGS